MELHQLRAFLAVAQTGQLTRAAERLHVSQPALSAQIKSLEQALSQPLFERKPTGMALTRHGRQLLPHAAKTIAAYESLRAAARSLRGELVGRLTIGSVSDPQSMRIGELVARTLERHPQLELDIHDDITGRALERVRAGELDATFYFGQLAAPGVDGVALGERVYCVAGPGAWRTDLERADLAALVRMPWVLPPDSSTLHAMLFALFRDAGSMPTQIVEGDSEAVILNLVESGLGLSLVREDYVAARADPGLLAVWGDARWRMPLWFIYAAERSSDPAVRALIDVVSELWNVGPTLRAPAHVASVGAISSS
jgi:DNA-binding transcriptional LysR family regulator